MKGGTFIKYHLDEFNKTIMDLRILMLELMMKTKP